MTGYWLPLGIALWIYLDIGVSIALVFWWLDRRETDPGYHRRMDELEWDGFTRPVLWALIVLRWPLVVRLLFGKRDGSDG